MKNNAGKCYIILSSEGFCKYPSWRDSLIENFYYKKSLNIVYSLNFDDHIKVICKKSNNKLKPLARVTLFVTLDKKMILMNSFFNAQFHYCILFNLDASQSLQ